MAVGLTIIGGMGTYATPVAFAAELNKQWPASLRLTGSAAQAIAYPALMRNIDAETLIATG